jgi:hypothetical protein
VDACLRAALFVWPTKIAEFSNGLTVTAALWRQVRQTIFTLEHLQWRALGGRYRRTPDRWQRTALGSADENRVDEP